MAVETIKKELRCYLTETETVGYAKKAAVLVERIEDQENEKKMTAKQYAAEISALQDELFGLSRKVRNGYEVRSVDCEIVSDFESKQVAIIRTDTGEPIESRKMTAKELQQPLFNNPINKIDSDYNPENNRLGRTITAEFPKDNLAEMVDEVVARIEDDAEGFPDNDLAPVESIKRHMEGGGDDETF